MGGPGWRVAGSRATNRLGTTSPSSATPEHHRHLLLAGWPRRKFWTLLRDDSIFVDWQRLKVQENVDEVRVWARRLGAAATGGGRQQEEEVGSRQQ